MAQVPAIHKRYFITICFVFGWPLSVASFWLMCLQPNKRLIDFLGEKREEKRKEEKKVNHETVD